MSRILSTVCLLSSLLVSEQAFSRRLTDRLSSEHEGFLEDRRIALPSLSDPYGVPAAARVVQEQSREPVRADTQWKRNVVGTVFWVGERPTPNNPTPNDKSAWDQNWLANFGGYDDPEHRAGWRPAGFVPQANPFYVALPYNDVAPGGVHRPEASEVIPWFWENFRGDGISVCKGRWVAIHFEGRVAYAQWEDVGPFETDHWQYVFGSEAPRANRNQAAGIDLSPAVRDFLGFRSGERVQWRFLHERQVPRGPWRDWSQHPQPAPPGIR
jgi:hypothetical protein